MKKAILVLISAILVLTLVSSSNAAWQRFKGVYVDFSYPTWDSDMINIENVDWQYTGEDVYVAVLDTGITPNWRDYFDKERIATEYGMGFWQPAHMVDPVTEEIEFGPVTPCSYIGSTGTCHGTHVASTIIGYYYQEPYDWAYGLGLPPIYVDGIAPDVKIIPVKILHDYHFPGYTGPAGVVFGTDWAIAAGIDYVTSLKLGPLHDNPVIISMSIGGPEPDTTGVLEQSIDNAIAAGVIVVAAAGNDGLEGMDWPGAYPQVISVGSTGWRYEWWWPGDPDGPDGPYYAFGYRYRLWWLQSGYYPYIDVAEAPDLTDDVYVSDFSGRENQNRFPGYPQELDVLAPGSWVRGPYPGLPGYSHIPWWSPNWGWLNAPIPGNFYYVGGTSMATPHVSAVAARMLEKNPTLNQFAVEAILESTALPIPPGSMTIYDAGAFGWGWYTYDWGGSEATGYGLIQADEAVDAA